MSPEWKKIKESCQIKKCPDGQQIVYSRVNDETTCHCEKRRDESSRSVASGIVIAAFLVWFVGSLVMIASAGSPVMSLVISCACCVSCVCTVHSALMASFVGIASGFGANPTPSDYIKAIFSPPIYLSWR
jgi:hypothetical protein